MTVGGAGEYTLIEDDRAFADLLDRLAGQDRYAIDTEFHRERTYFPHVALVQIADEHGVALVDALSVDLTPFSRILDSDAVAVMHAARQDMEVLERSTGIVPRRLIDTQVAAGFLGYTSPSLSTLLERELKVRALKADRLTDWLRRPLKPAQLDYAAADVAYLLELHDVLWTRLTERGRDQWVLDACEELRTEYRGPRDPDDAWRRIKELRHLRGGTLAVAQAVAGWRERRAIETDQTPRFVLSDLGVVSVASAAPTTIEELRSLRGVDGRSLRGGMGDDLLSVIAASVGSRPQRAPAQTVPELPGELRPAVPLISAWVSQLARELELETSMLATRADLEDLLRGVPEARLTQGWRAELVGEPIRRLLEGEAALAFDRTEGLVLEDRQG
ncbi:ribonuclease D [Dermatobacter hominis]|uniref:ribonuclease D n=1 Tax=Dermatobacter hominis TaxID=2884263 RepID=UPI001D0FE9AA|nr:HRDC domain-containing protein [Dermatobacter hominis]UDY36430.1 HRDC domain-containing protein [Dermatobacter hominis]